MTEYTQIKGGGKSRHLPIGTPGSCLTEADRDAVVDSTDFTGPQCRRCRVPAKASRVIEIEFTVNTASPATVLDIARTQATNAFDCIVDDPALTVTVGTGTQQQDGPGRYQSDWLFLVNAAWDTETGTLKDRERRGLPERRSTPDRRR